MFKKVFKFFVSYQELCYLPLLIIGVIKNNMPMLIFAAVLFIATYLCKIYISCGETKFALEKIDKRIYVVERNDDKLIVAKKSVFDLFPDTYEAVGIFNYEPHAKRYKHALETGVFDVFIGSHVKANNDFGQITPYELLLDINLSKYAFEQFSQFPILHRTECEIVDVWRDEIGNKILILKLLQKDTLYMYKYEDLLIGGNIYIV